MKNCTQIRNKRFRVTRSFPIILHHLILHPQLSPAPDFDRMLCVSDGCALLKQRVCSMFHIQATSSWLPKRLAEHTQEVFRGWPALTTIIIHPSHVHLFIHNMKVPKSLLEYGTSLLSPWKWTVVKERFYFWYRIWQKLFMFNFSSRSSFSSFKAKEPVMVRSKAVFLLE